MTPAPTTAADLVASLGGHGASARCPAHDDGQASLSVSEAHGRILVHCHAGCTQLEVLGALRSLGLWADKPAPKPRGSNGNGNRGGGARTLVATYDYRDADGALRYQVCRFAPKDFRQRRPAGTGPDDWVWNMKGITRIPYRLPEVLAGIVAGQTLWIVEGEKDADALRSLGILATCNTGGAGKWTLACSKLIAHAPRIRIIPDDDEPGRAHAVGVRRSLIAAGAADVRIVPLPGDGKDAADWVHAGGTLEQLEQLAEQSPTTPPDEPAPATPDSAPEFIRDDKGQVVAKAIPNITRALDLLGVKLWFDSFTELPMIQERPDSPPEALQDYHLDRWWIRTDAAFSFRPSLALWRTVVCDYARSHSRHPVREYLDSLAWDGTARIDRWLIDMAGATDSPYTRAVSSLVLIAAVRRVRSPGCKFDEMLVLETPQGASKSSALAALCPDRSWFNDDLPLGCDAKEAIERTTGVWIVEAAELSGMRRSEVEQVKGFLSRASDRARLAYGRLPVNRLRQFVAVGTTNDDAYLQDTTGNRRFWPVKVLEFDPDAIAAIRDQLWAEAAHREAIGESIRLPAELWADAGAEQEARRLVDDWERQLEETLGDMTGLLAIEDAWRIIGHHDCSRRQPSDSFRLTRIMTRLGWTRSREYRRRSGARVKYFSRGESLGWIEIRSGEVVGDGDDPQQRRAWPDDR